MKERRLKCFVYNDKEATEPPLSTLVRSSKTTTSLVYMDPFKQETRIVQWDEWNIHTDSKDPSDRVLDADTLNRSMEMIRVLQTAILRWNGSALARCFDCSVKDSVLESKADAAVSCSSSASSPVNVFVLIHPHLQPFDRRVNSPSQTWTHPYLRSLVSTAIDVPRTDAYAMEPIILLIRPFEQSLPIALKTNMKTFRNQWLRVNGWLYHLQSQLPWVLGVNSSSPLPLTRMDGCYQWIVRSSLSPNMIQMKEVRMNDELLACCVREEGKLTRVTVWNTKKGAFYGTLRYIHDSMPNCSVVRLILESQPDTNHIVYGHASTLDVPSYNAMSPSACIYSQSSERVVYSISLFGPSIRLVLEHLPYGTVCSTYDASQIPAYDISYELLPFETRDKNGRYKSWEWILQQLFGCSFIVFPVDSIQIVLNSWSSSLSMSCLSAAAASSSSSSSSSSSPLSEPWKTSRQMEALLCPREDESLASQLAFTTKALRR